MNISHPDQDALSSLVKNEYQEEIQGLDFSGMAFNIAEQHKNSDEEFEDLDDDTETSSNCDEDNIQIPDINKVVKHPEIIQKKTKDDKYSNHAKLLSDVQELIKALEQEDIPVPDKFKKMTSPSANTQQLRVVKASLSDLLDTHTTALHFTDWIIQGSVMLSAIFNGENAIPFLKIKPNLSGYSARLKKGTAELNKENMRVARKINKKVGKSTMSIFKWFSLVILPGIITLGNNHSPTKLVDYDKHDDLESDDESEESSEGSDESSRESEYISSEG